MVHVVARAEQPQFFAGERHEQDAALRFRLGSHAPRQLDHAGGAGSVVIGAGVDGSG